MEKIRISISVGHVPSNYFTSFEIWINNELNYHQVNYKINEKIIEEVVIDFLWTWNNNKEKILKLILTNPKTRSLKQIRKEKLNKINEEI